MSRFGSTGTIYWDTGDDLSSPSTITLSEQDMPDYPMEDGEVSDRIMHRTLSGKAYEYENYNLKSYIFNWVNLRETKRDEIATMVKSLPIFSFNSGGNDFGTLRVVPNSFQSDESSFELYNISFEAEEDQ